MQKTYYQILGVTPEATESQILAAHMKAVARLMDSGLDDPDSNALLDAARDTLLDPAARASYDESLRAPDPTPRLARAAAPEPDLEPVGGDAGAKPWKSLGMFALALLGTLIVGWLLLRSTKPSDPVVAAPVKPDERTMTSTVGDPQPPPAEAPKGDASKAADPKPRTAEQVFADVSNSVVKVVVTNEAGTTVGTGSGVVIARQTVITNCHVALKGPLVSVKTPKESYPANVTTADEEYDLCKLDVGGLNAPSVEIGASQYVRTGQKVFAIGAPQGLELTISEGIVSALRETPLGNLIQTTAPISPGSSGGGLFNVNAQLIGITTFQHKSGQNLNFAVPADWIEKMTTRSGSGPIPK
ncbi:MAG: trypsin-like peptidase domain-containing protein [Betaproteobacteria bacterium]|nr:trypsin-like peptidase domain-containing protein [Betaproteobacteria bacterium]